MLQTLTVSMSNGAFTVLLLLTFIMGFVGGCIWYSLAKKPISPEEEDENKNGHVIDIDESILKDNTYSWKRTVN